MPISLPLPAAFRSARWKVKVREKENREPPHVTLLNGTRAWRIDLRTGEFMDLQPDPAEVPEKLIAYIKAAANWKFLCDGWNAKYPANQVEQQEKPEE